MATIGTIEALSGSAAAAPPDGGRADGPAALAGPAADEQTLVRRAVRQPAAFAELYRRHQPAIARYVRRRLGTGALAEDAVAETFVAALENLPRYEPRGVPFRAWLYRLALTRIARHARAARRAQVLALEGEPEARPEHAPDPRAALARAALLELPRRYQEALSLRYLEGLSVEETARVLAAPIGTVKARLARGRVRLRERLERHLREDGR